MRNGEKLFLALGQVEESRLERSELALPSHEKSKEEPSMKKPNPGRIFRNLLVAAIILSMLTITAYAVAGYILYDSPEEMLSSLFGDRTGFDHKGVTTGSDPEKPGSSWDIPGYDRVPADTKAVEEIAPYVSPVGQSITLQGSTLTVDAFLYDSGTGCGMVTYTLENPPEYSVEYDGMVSFTPDNLMVYFNQYGYCYIIQEKTTDQVLAATHYFHYDPSQELSVNMTYAEVELSDLDKQMEQEVMAQYTPEEAVAAAREYLDGIQGEGAFAKFAEGFWDYGGETRAAYSVLRDKRVLEEYREEESEKIVFDCSKSSGVKNVTLGGGSVTVSPISLRVDITDLEFLHRDDGYVDVDNLDEITLCFTDGTEYTVASDTVNNSLFALGTQKEESNHRGPYVIETRMFNRIVDLDKVQSIRLNGQELNLD